MSDLPSSPAQVGPTSPDELSGLFPPTTSATVRGEDAKGGLSPPSTPYDTIRALGSMSTCLSMFGRRDSAWAVMSLAGKIAQGCGMHRDPARWHMDPQTIQRRRTLWWEVLTSDISHSLALGRPPSIMLSFVDCEFPDDEEAQVVNTPGVEKEGQGDTVGMGFWRMKYTFARDSFMSVITSTLMAKTPSYATVMNLDRKVREMTLPAGFKPYVKLEEDGEEVYHNSHFSLRDFYASQHRTVTMLYLHRSYFAHALLTCPKNPLLSPFAPSVLAAYRAASVIIKAAVHLFDRCPKLAGRVWFLIYHVFSAAVTVGTVVRRSPNSTITPNALLDLGLAVDLFGKCANESHRTKVAYLVLKKLKEKAEKSYAEFQKNKAAAASPSDSMRLEAISPSTEPISSPDAAGDAEGTPTGNEQELEENEDELEIFGGQTKLLMRKDRKGKMAKRKGSSTLSLGSGDPSAPSASGSTPGSIAESSPSPAALSSAGNGNENRDVDSAMNASGSGSGGTVSIGLDEPWDINSMNMNQDMDLGNMDAYASGLDIPMDIPMDLGGVGLDAAMGFGAGTTGTATGGLAPDGFGMGGMDAVESEGSSQAGPSNAVRGVRPISEVHPSLVEYLSGAETNMGGFTTRSHSQRSFESWGSSTATGSLGSSSFAPYDIGPSLDSIDWSNIMLGSGTSQSPVASTSSTSASATSGNGSTRHGMPASSQSQTSRSASAAKDAVDMEELYNRFIQYLAQKQSELPGSHLAALLQNSETNLHHSGPASIRGHDHLNGTLSPYSFLHSRFGGPSNWPYVDSTIGIPGPTATQNSWLKTNFFQTLQNQQQSSDNNAGGDYRRLWQSLGLAQNSGMSAAPINSRWSTNSGAQSETHDDMDLGWSNVMRGAGLMDEGGRSG
ncbi:hypothetical protein VKT23_011903 [Stygiomarasmius scandens]|uniref:Xylanolytic transcriptional activator regulatory domain-containing protein n=1 Tax=Marasmiellus scandens TaxID=2682957 RepID=A0ABR1J897_9AGAR